VKVEILSYFWHAEQGLNKSRLSYLLQGKIYVRKYTNTSPKSKDSQRGRVRFYVGGGEGEGCGRWSRVMSGGQPDFVSEMYSPRARIRLGSDQSVASCLREETFFSRRFLTPNRARQVRMACWKDSGPIPHPGQVASRSLSNQEEGAAWYLFPACIW